MNASESAARDRISHLFATWMDGDSRAHDDLFAALYQELRHLARWQLRSRPRDGTLDTTALVHEAYLRLVAGAGRPLRDRGHFLTLASRVMRQIIVDHVRRKYAAKRGAGLVEPLLENQGLAGRIGLEELLALDVALNNLHAEDPRLAQVVDLRFFAGASEAEAAEALGVSLATVKRDWQRARAFLYRQIRGTPDP